MMDLGFWERGVLDELVGLSDKQGNLTRMKQNLGL
jgi:hypothetical protein